MNKFLKNLQLSDKELTDKRAERIANGVKDAQANLIINLKSSKRDIESEIENLEDMGRHTNYSLLPTHEKFNEKEWVASYQKLSIDLSEVDVEIEIAEENQTKWFVEEEKTEKDA